MSPGAVTARLRELSDLSDLGPDRPFLKVDLSPAGVTRRLRQVSQMRDLCLWLGELGRAAGLGDGRQPQEADPIQEGGRAPAAEGG